LFLLKEGMNPNWTNKQGENALQKAAEFGNGEIFNLLVKNGAVWNTTSENIKNKIIVKAFSVQRMENSIKSSFAQHQDSIPRNSLLTDDHSEESVIQKHVKEFLPISYSSMGIRRESALCSCNFNC